MLKPIADHIIHLGIPLELVYKYSMIIRDMVKLFPLGDLEPMAGPTILPQHTPYPKVRSCYICFIYLIHYISVMWTDDLVLHLVKLTNISQPCACYCKILFKRGNCKLYFTSLCWYCPYFSFCRNANKSSFNLPDGYKFVCSLSSDANFRVSHWFFLSLVSDNTISSTVSHLQHTALLLQAVTMC